MVGIDAQFSESTLWTMTSAITILLVIAVIYCAFKRACLGDPATSDVAQMAKIHINEIAGVENTIEDLESKMYERSKEMQLMLMRLRKIEKNFLKKANVESEQHSDENFSV